MGELAEALGVTQQAASKSVLELEKLGYVERQPDLVDSRVRRIATHATLGDVRPVDANAFLRRLGFGEVEPPSVAGLHRLHRAFVERVPYEVIDIQLERPTIPNPHRGVALRLVSDGLSTQMTR